MDLLGLRKTFPSVNAKILEEGLRTAADLEQVERCIQDLLQQNPKRSTRSSEEQTETLLSLFAIFGGSAFLSRFVLQNFDIFLDISSSKSLHEQKPHSQFHKEIYNVIKNPNIFEQFCAVLRRHKYEQILRIAIRDLRSLAPIEEITAEISDLASACTEAAYQACRHFLDPQQIVKEKFVVLGMGKLGGGELNFSSDIDLIYLYDTNHLKPESPLQHRGLPSTLHEYFSRLSEKITRALSAITPEGFVWRVDLRLRPDGNQGPLCHSVTSALTYYESWGRTWERAALFKARPVAGNLELGESLLRQLEPWLYRRYLDFGTLEDIENLKERINREVEAQKKETWDLKLGIGGIREVEFFIQTIQLVNAGKNPSVRERNTLQALKQAAEEGLIEEEIADSLSSAYRFYRKVEHRLQMLEERQTQRLPSKPEELEKLARRSGFWKTSDFVSELDSHRQTVQKIFNTLLGSSRRSEATDPEMERILREEASEKEILQWLQDHRLQDPSAALKNIRLLREGPPYAYFSDKAKRAFERLGPLFIKEVIASPNPDQALIHLERFVTAIGSRGGIYSLLLENPKTLQLLVNLFGSSVFLSNFLIAHLELLDALVLRGYAKVQKTRAELEEELRESLKSLSNKEDCLIALRQFKNGEVLRIAVNDLWGDLDGVSVCEQLSDLAEIALQNALGMAQEEVKKRFKIEAPLAIFALGKLAGRELNYHSDLDIIFIIPNESSAPLEAYTMAAQRVISNLAAILPSGYLYKVDTRLRPSGTRGPLVTSLSTFENYNLTQAAVWEKLALTRFRWIAGNKDLEALVTQAVERCLKESRYLEADWREVDRIRGRMEKELAHEEGGKYNLKTGHGGLVDIEFIVQKLELEAAFAEPNTWKALERLQAAGLLDPAVGTSIKEHYLFLRRLENRLRIVGGYSVSELPKERIALEAVARRMGYADLQSKTAGEQLMEEYTKRTREIRKIYQRFFHRT
ncbi:MAG: bifunctional [glutamate--ammonia ligase]-adenylyl-L-tyrosine phosphorylase/[glutamate--ammonia-ligase] adenylyltransferase [Deltaproteobacteria bacterium]|nr:bifunctional [glutamate--ammonia ligase]-adenylyl-L-tyrosine phosphorylase/[glutamate--ammonia-ligase] adenylyltransferase [Deltaproteobacteria bacterium]